jgi:hypothetical protein
MAEVGIFPSSRIENSSYVLWRHNGLSRQFRHMQVAGLHPVFVPVACR